MSMSVLGLENLERIANEHVQSEKVEALNIGLEELKSIMSKNLDTMLANPFGMNRMIDPRMAMQLMEEAKRNQMMMLSPYDMMDPARLQARLRQIQQVQAGQAHIAQAASAQAQAQQQMIKGQHPSVSSSQQSSNTSRRQQKAKPSKRVIAVDLPSNLQTIESVTTIFYPYGEVLLVRVLRPKKQLPFDLKQFQAEIPDLGKTVCAIIEFEQADAARFAVQALKMRTKAYGFRLALLEAGAEEDLYGPELEPQLPMLKPGQAGPGTTDESGIGESERSGRSSGSDRDSDCDIKERYRVSSGSESDTDLKNLTEKWNPDVAEFVPGQTSPKKRTTSKTSVKIGENGRITTSLSINLSSPSKGRTTSRLSLTPKKEQKAPTYTREYLLSVRHHNGSKFTPTLDFECDEMRRYVPPQRRTSQPIIQLSPQRRNSLYRR
ncbi:Oidioi.mRNA.OKI2018_I69.chr2.g4842.t1.cds [Oikopleura dioica]|uniref:Oidioi.mRNA.OKI2018_I69.chr2.g4842.t1.cds n=1 Tax=Oikopleura dioica TaxID=34765 RepID=A0ABN7T571_OIKDI|nr:Oidioi.mRNA.OKI2018_I69.chr2.g4842.t1.cds [Oikopleura dioica]